MLLFLVHHLVCLQFGLYGKETSNQEELKLNDIRKRAFFELMGEVKTIAENLNAVVINEKIWEIQLQFTAIRDLLGRAEIILKYGFNDEKTD